MTYEFLSFLREKILENLPPTFNRVDGKFNGRCPFCGDSKKSTTKKRGWIYFNKDCSYYCFNCSTGMSGIKFLEAISGQAYPEIKREYTKLFLKSGLSSNLSAVYDIPQYEPKIFDVKPLVKPEWKNPLSDNAQQYLANRLVTKAPFY